MKLSFPSPEFDDAVAAVCHGSASDAQMRALNELLRRDAAARDEYLMRIELHNHLSSEPGLFSQLAESAAGEAMSEIRLKTRRNIIPRIYKMPKPSRTRVQLVALAACLALIAGGVWSMWFKRPATKNGTTSTAVAMLARAVDAHWAQNADLMRTGSALEPGWLRLESGQAQVVFYSGARVVIEGPTELQVISPTEAYCPRGRLLAEVPQPARGFRLRTGQLNLVDLGTSFGIDATRGRTEVHVFKGKVQFTAGTALAQTLPEGRAAAVQGSAPPRLFAANTATFSGLLELQKRSLASDAIRYDQWRVASARLSQDRSLVVHLTIEDLASSDFTLSNAAEVNRSVQEATIVGCQHAEGRWPEKQALEFQSVNDRVRLAVPGSFDSMTLSTWVRIKGLDRQFNSLFMCDGFEPGGIHWLIRNDGVLGLTVKGLDSGDFQILASGPVIALDKFGMWIHLAVVLDGKSKQVVHYVDGSPVARKKLRLDSPFRLGAAELGNWNAQGGSDPAPNLIRNLSGSLDEFELFSRALSDEEVHELYILGKPQIDL